MEMTVAVSKYALPVHAYTHGLVGNPIGGLVFSSAFGDGMLEMHEWTVSRFTMDF